MSSVKYKIFAILLLIPGLVFSQDSTKVFSLEEALSYAMEHSYVSRNSGIEVEVARKRVWETVAKGLPQIDGSASYNINLNLPVSLIPGEMVGEEPGTYVPVQFGQNYNADFGLSVSQLIFDGSYFVGLQAANIYLKLAANQKEKTEVDIREAVTSAYHTVLVSEESKKIIESNLATTTTLLEETEALYKSGFREEQDVDQIRLMLMRSKSEAIKADREIKVAKMVLKYVIGFDVNNDISLSDNLELFLSQTISDKEDVDSFDYITHIDYRLLDTQISLKKSQLKLEKTAYLPKVNAFLHYLNSTYSNDANLFKEEWYPSSVVGISLNIPIFSSGMRSSLVKQARMQLEITENEQFLNVQSLQKEYLTSILDLESALDRFENDLENSALAKSIYDKTLIKFNNGISSSIDLSQHEQQYLDSHATYIQAVHQLLQAKLKLDKAMGSL